MKIKILNIGETQKTAWKDKILVISKPQLKDVFDEDTKSEITRSLDYITSNKIETCGKHYLATFNFIVKDHTSLNPEEETIGLYTDFETFSIYITQNKSALVKKLEKHITKESSPSSLLMALIGDLTENDYLKLESLENEFTKLEDSLEKEKDLDKVNKKINAYRKTLVLYKQHYEQLTNINEFFESNPIWIDSQEEKVKFAVLDRRIPKLKSEVFYLRDLLYQLRDSWQSQFEMRQNHLMKIFTIITAIFMPLQLIAGWYGMNLIMPEVKWTYAYPVIIVLCILTVTGMFIFFAKKKWFK